MQRPELSNAPVARPSTVLRSKRWVLDVLFDGAVPDGTLRSMISRNAIPHVRISPRRVMFDEGQLRAWLADRSRGGR